MCFKHFFVDTGERHICVCHDVRSCADQVFCNLHCILRKSKCICISEIRTRVNHSFCHRLLHFRDHNTAFFQFFCNNCKTAPLDLFRQHKFYCLRISMDLSQHLCKYPVLFFRFYRDPVITALESPEITTVTNQNTTL